MPNPAPIPGKPTAAAAPLWKNKTVLVSAAIALVAAAGGATYALWPKNYETLAAELAQKGPEEVRKAVDSGQIPREVAWDAFGQAREAEMQKRVDAYFALQTPAERQRFLDQSIDEFQARMRQWQQQAGNRPGGPGGPPGGMGRGNREGGPTTQPTAEQRAERERRRAERADRTSPQQRAQRVEFMAAVSKRMQERGIQMPFGRGSGGGGGGRGPG